jgi:lysophospholipase L1-like esterase
VICRLKWLPGSALAVALAIVTTQGCAPTGASGPADARAGQGGDSGPAGGAGQGGAGGTAGAPNGQPDAAVDVTADAPADAAREAGLVDAGSGGASDADARAAMDSGPTDLKVESPPVQPGDGTLGDKNIKYVGRWDFTDRTQFVSYWGGAYLTVAFTGTTLKVKVGSATNLYARIDKGAWTKLANVNGVVNVTPTALTRGTHVAVVSGGKDYGYELRFGGLVLDAGATTEAAPTHPTLVEFIGDSITAGFTDTMADVSDYAWVAAETLNVEHTQIAYPGIALVNGYGLNGDKAGMDREYFKLKLGYTTNPDWDFSVYTPALIVINLGTNDRSTNVPASAFLTSYTGFLTAIRARFPQAEILVMRCFNGALADPTRMAVTARTTMGDTKVHYVDTTGWLIAGDYNDGTHPSDAGQMKIAALLTPILTQYLPAAR